MVAKKPEQGDAEPARKMIAGYFSDDCHMQLKRLALDERTSVQELLREALNDLFAKPKYAKKYKLKPIA